MAYGPGDRGTPRRKARPKRKRYTPTKRAVAQAKAQARTYASQGVAVERAANRARKVTAPKAKVTSRAQARYFKSQGKSVERTGTAQRKVARQYRRYLRMTAPERYYKSQGESVKREAESFKSMRARYTRWEKTGQSTKLQGTANTILRLPAGLVGSAAALATATYKDPVGVPLKTLKQAGLAIPAALGGTVEMVKDPIKTTKQVAKDFEQRVANEDFDEKVKRIREQGGFADIADIALALAPAGAGTRGGLTKLGGPRAQRVVSDAIIKDAPRTGAVRYYLGRKVDAKRAAKLERRLKAAEEGGPGLKPAELTAALANRRGGDLKRPVALPAGKLKRKLTFDVARERARGVYRFKHDLQDRISQVEKALAPLNKAESTAFYYGAVFGIRSAEQARELLPALRSTIVDERQRRGIRVKGGLKRSDMLPQIDAILAAPEKHFTKRLDDAIESVRAESLRAGREDPALTARQTISRRYMPVGELLGVRRGEFPNERQWQYFPGPEDFARAADRRTQRGETVPGSVVEAYDEAVRRNRQLPSGHPGRKQLPSGVKPIPEPPGAPLARWQMDRELGTRFVPRAKREGKGYWEEVEVPGAGYRQESTAAYIKRLGKEMEGKGLRSPLYFRSERYVGPMDFASRAVGGKRAMREDGRYTGSNLRLGLQDTSLEQFRTGLARNIKRKNNWNMVIRMVDRYRIAGLAPSNGTSFKDIRQRVYQAGLDEAEVAYWNPGVFRDVLQTAAREADVDADTGAPAAAAGSTQRSLVQRTGDFEVPDETPRVVQDAMKAATYVDGGALPAEKYRATKGWQAIPKPVWTELERQTTPSGAAGRGWDIAKGKASRVLLLSGNVPWLGFQVASNTIMSTAATGGRALNPANWVGAARWWRGLDPETKREVGSILGLDTHGYDHTQVRLGATTNSSMVNAYRAFKAHPMFQQGMLPGHRGPALRQLNPFEAMAQLDRRQNNVFRLLTAYTKAKPELYRSLAANSGRLDAAQARLAGVLRMPPEEQLRRLSQDPRLIDDLAETTRDFLGDYTSMTAFERRVLGRVPMFYPYLRYSLRLVLYVMPVKHPTATAILAQLGSMRATELRELFGSDRIYWDLGKIHFGKGDDVKSIDLRRANPALNALFDVLGAENPEQLVGMAPPYVQWVVDQALSQSTFRGADWRVKGKAAGYGPKFRDYDAETRGRIVLNQALSTIYPYRLASKMTQPGTQGDDTLLWDRRPTKFKGRADVDKARAAAAKQQEAFERANTNIVNELLPMLPRPDNFKARAAAQRRIIALEKRKKKRKKTGGSKSLTGGGGSNSLTGGSGGASLVGR